MSKRTLSARTFSVTYLVRWCEFEKLSSLPRRVVPDTKDDIHHVKALEEHRSPRDILEHIGDNEKKLSAWTAIERYPKTTAYSITVTLGILLVCPQETYESAIAWAVSNAREIEQLLSL